MVLVKLDSSCIVSNRSIEVALLPVCKAPIMIEVCLPWLDLDRSREALNSLNEVSTPIERYALVIVRVGVLRVDLDRCSVV